MRNFYLDYAATTPLSLEMRDYIRSLLDRFHNPSSPYSQAQQIRQIIEDTRNTVMSFIRAMDGDIVFTSSGSAANTLAIKGYYEGHMCSVLYSPIAHKSIIQCAKHCKCQHPLEVDKQGYIDLNKLENKLASLDIKAFVVVDYANSEIGTIQNVKQIIDLTHKYNGVIMLDCTGSISTIPINVKELNADIITFSAHKLGALQGCGVLYKKSDIELEPLVYGSQEQGLFAGTENVLGIASLGKAIENYDYSAITSYSRDYVYNYILKNISDVYLVGAPIGKSRLPHNLYLCCKGVYGESLMALLDMNGIQVGIGSACNNHTHSPSSALLAINMDDDDIKSCIRMTFSGQESEQDLIDICQTFKFCLDVIRER